jgi:hypothetical protein
MRARRHWKRPWLMLAVLCVAGTAARCSDKAKIAAVRWDEQRPGCTFSRSDDGHFHYGLSFGDVGITVSVDSQELEKVHHRHEAFFAAQIDIRYHGKASLDLGVQNISMEFIKHFKVEQTALDPDDLSRKIQNDSDELDHQTAREIQKHPEKKDAQEAYMRAFLKDSAELQEFVGKSSLRATTLNSSNPEASGWVFFNTDSKWIGTWKKPEDFILRIPLDGKMFEFPFQLPPKPGDVLLRRRE